ncbi:MAG: 50S ribosomal protein L24 [Actinomycetota bacterium]|nr:50S ribosomal protein L24 [Actinomycetota bacterium]
MKIRKGDKVKVLAGKERGREGTVTRVLPGENRLIIERVNVAKKHLKPNNKVTQGGIIDKDMPISASNVQIICSADGPTRVGYKFNSDGVKVRVCKKCGGEL